MNRTCTDGRKKRKKAVTGDVTFLTLSTESVLLTTTIDVHEGRDVGICNIPGDFIGADIDKDVKMALRGRLAELMVHIAPQIYTHFVIYEKGRTVLYVTLKEALYGCLRSA